MNRNIRFLAGGLAAVAVASAVTLAGPSAYAADGADRPCGQPAVPAVLVTVITEPVLRAVPAVTHDEWLWQRDVTVLEHEFTRLVSPAYTETDWVRTGTVEQLWSHTVVDQEAVAAVPGTDEQGHFETVLVNPAITVTLFEYVQQQTGRTRWEAPDWNTQEADSDTGKGWTRSGVTREEVVTPAETEEVWMIDQAAVPGTAAVPEISHLEYLWSGSSPGAGWSGPLDTRVLGGGETATTVGDDVPAGSGWTEVGTREVPAVVDSVWAVDAPAGYAATGSSRVKEVTAEETTEATAAAPTGEGWTPIEKSRIVVVDQAEFTEILGEGSVTQVEATPAQPATEPCVAAASTNGAAVASSASVQGAGQATTAAAVSDPKVRAHHAAAHTATVLPEVGSPVSPLLVTAGLGALLAGGALVRGSRRGRTT